MRILLTFCCLMAMLALPASTADNNSTAEYLGGTVKGIPVNTVGILDLTDPSDLIFWYGKGSYRLPFQDIRSFELAGPGAGANRSRHHLGQVPLPNFSWAKSGHDKALNLSYRSLGTSVGVLSFKLIGKDFARAEWIMKTRTERSGEAAAGNRAKLPEAWWGDGYWRTTRNAPRWPAIEPETLAGTK